MKPIFEKYNKKNNIQGAGPCITGCCRAAEGILLYMKWIHDSNATGEVIKCRPRAAEVLQYVQIYYPCREGTDEWNIPKMCGAYLMAVDQIVRHGCGNGTDTQDSRRMHHEFIEKIARNTQRRASTFGEQLAQRRHKNFTIEKTVEENVDVLMSLSGRRGCDSQREPTACSDLHTTPLCWFYYDHDIPLYVNTEWTEGVYTMEVSAAVDHS